MLIKKIKINPDENWCSEQLFLKTFPVEVRENRFKFRDGFWTAFDFLCQTPKRDVKTELTFYVLKAEHDSPGKANHFFTIRRNQIEIHSTVFH